MMGVGHCLPSLVASVFCSAPSLIPQGPVSPVGWQSVYETGGFPQTNPPLYIQQCLCVEREVFSRRKCVWVSAWAGAVVGGGFKGGFILHVCI